MDDLKQFLDNRPEHIAAYGYGSGVFKQSGYTSKDKPQKDMIIIVKDLIDYHSENMKLNKGDYSWTGKFYINHADISDLKGSTGIVYLSNIKENGSVYKYGTIEYGDFVRHLKLWDSYYLAGRFQKPIYPISEEASLIPIIEENRRQGLLLSAFLQDDEKVSKKDVLTTLCWLSYLGDTRMGIAENPDKVINIVNGSYDKFLDMYNFDEEYFIDKGDNILIDKYYVKDELVNLPDSLYQYVLPYLEYDEEVITEKIIEYFTNLNKFESKQQTIKGLYTNGFSRSSAYAWAKVLKKLKSNKSKIITLNKTA